MGHPHFPGLRDPYIKIEIWGARHHQKVRSDALLPFIAELLKHSPAAEKRKRRAGDKPTELRKRG